MNRWIVICLFLLAFLLCAGTCAAEGRAPERISGIPDAGWQAVPAFPDWKNYVDDTLAMNNMFSFRFWHGQGRIFLDVADGVEGFLLYLNGEPLDTAGITAGTWSVDISGAARNGVNTLQLSGLRYSGEADKAVTVYIPYPEVLPGDAAEEGIRPETLRLISDLIEADISHGFPSAQLAVVRNGRLVYEHSWGFKNSFLPDGTPVVDGDPVTAETMYDLASVTKMFSAVYAVQRLAEEGRLDVNAPVVSILGDAFAEDTVDLAYKGVENPPDHETQINWKRSLTVRDVLCHEAGFPAAPQYNNPDYDLAAQEKGLPGSNPAYAAGREETLQAIFRTPLLYEPRSRTLYSDVDYMLAAFIIERITGTRLDDYMKETFFDPLGLEHISFTPLEHGFTADQCAATELNGNTRDGRISFPGIRTETIQGEVHDERAYYCMGGISGHAGLFSSATDLAKLASVMLTGGSGEHRFFSRNILDFFTAPKSAAFGQWGLGWWRQGDEQRPWYFGTQAPSGTFGHQGWTGTLAMVDPARELVVIYLTNRINSPILPGDADSAFSGNCFTASTLGFVPQLLSVGMDGAGDVSRQLLDLLADMTLESVKRIPKEGSAVPAYEQNTLSKAEVLRRWAQEAGNEEYVKLADELTARYGNR